MSRFVREILLFFGIQAAIFFAAWGALYRPDPNAFAGVMIDKHDLLETQASPRLILVGGSSQAYGVISPTLERELGLHPVNLGWFAGLGPDFLLNWAEAYVRPGDVALVSLEYELFAMDMPPDLNVIQMLELEPELARFLSAAQWKTLVDHGVPRYAGHVTRKLRGRQRAPEGGRKAYNAYGDIADTNRPSGPATADQVRMPTPRPGGRVDETIAHIARFRAACEARGGKALFAFPPISDAAFAAQAPVIRAIEGAIVRSGAIPLLDGAEDGIMPARLFGDSAYHPTGEGAAVRTERLAGLLGKALRP